MPYSAIYWEKENIPGANVGCLFRKRKPNIIGIIFAQIKPGKDTPQNNGKAVLITDITYSVPIFCGDPEKLPQETLILPLKKNRFIKKTVLFVVLIIPYSP